MRLTRSAFVVMALLLCGLFAEVSAEVRHEIAFPNLPGYQTLVCDFHMHTVFSDGQVWPPIRVEEAWRTGFDAIAITDHIEYQPHKDDVPTKHNRPYELALGPARAFGILLARGAEITRETPPGHFNALFLSDVAAIDTPELLDAVRLANEQGGFVFWNHQAWQGEEAGRWLEVHEKMFTNKWLHGMEVCNGDSYYPTAHRWCLERGLTMLGNSDIHDPDLRQRSLPGDHRTATLVFVKDRSLEGIKQALMEGRTAVWFGEQLIGRKTWLRPLFDACVHVACPHLVTKKRVYVRLANRADVDIHLKRTGSAGPAEIHLPARTTVLVKLPPLPEQGGPMKLDYQVTNFLIAPGESLPVQLTIERP